ncbi:hypothetical protein KS4_29310 [Poriferisphaera corsica]|uniref:Uncharacterized protein n=1 Tax=Poriferisphaera corsica TaxID=2528020 RepID=A0A517YXA3_9BACT|nr:hypothetical protein [Poriferisphaera corsica]QDU34855.1 hypothetical protein KS4_29310 [Poriferisphaera corsica]
MAWSKIICIAIMAVGLSAGNLYAQLSTDASRVFTFRNELSQPQVQTVPSRAVEYYPKYYSTNQPVQTTRVVQRKIVDRSSLVSNGIAKQPTWPNLVEVRQGSITVFVDPTDVLLGKRVWNKTGGIDYNHSLRQSQRLFNTLNNQPRVFTEFNGHIQQESGVYEMFSPEAIIHKPIPGKHHKKRKTPRNYVEIKQKMVKSSGR